MYAILASGTTLAGLALLYSAWRRWLAPRVVIVVGGWVLIALSALLWKVAWGWEYGAVYFICALPLLAWLFIAYQASFKAKNRNNEAVQQPVKLPSLQKLARQVGLFLLAVPVACVTSAVLALALTSLMPWQEVDRLAAITLLMPTLWGLLMFWCCADPKIMRPATTIVVVGLLSALSVGLGVGLGVGPAT